MNVSPVYHGAPAESRTPVEDRTYAALTALGIPFDRVDHDPAEDMADCAVISQALGADICKNLLLTPRNRSAFYLLAMPGDKPFVTRELSKQIGSSRLSFATAEDLEQMLGVQPGSASVLGLLNDTEHRVILVLDRAVAESRWFGCHAAIPAPCGCGQRTCWRNSCPTPAMCRWWWSFDNEIVRWEGTPCTLPALIFSTGGELPR